MRLNRNSARAALPAATSAALAVSGCTAAVGGHGTAVLASTGSPPASATPGASSGAGTQAPIHFQDCTSQFNLSVLSFPPGRRAALSIGCATLNVPADYADGTGPTLNVEVVRVHDAKNTGGKALLVNPGGPGASGISLGVGLSAQVSDALIEHYDLVGFDPRGVGLSSPVSCISDPRKDVLNAASPNVLDAAGFAQAKAASASVAAACTAKYGSKLADYSTVQTAKDMDRIRQALGEPTLNYLGFSYGTELGAQYAHLFPTTVGRFVLDGAVDPYTDPISSFADQLKGFELAFDQFATNCRTTSPCRSLGDPRQAVYDVVAKANAHPIAAAGDPRKATSSLVLTGVLQALYSRSQWSSLASALIAARQGDGERLLQLADRYNERDSGGHYTNITDANTTIGCNDSPPGPTDATIRSTATAWQQAYPMFGLWAAGSLFSCQQWQPARTPVPVPSATSTPETVLVVGNLHDPATPYKGAQDLTKALGHAELLTWNGEGHTSYLEGSKCIDNSVDAYLVQGTLPATGTTC